VQLDSKIYVAGHAGLVGSAIIRELTALGYKNLVVRDFNQLDLCNQFAANHFFESERPEYVFLAAAKVGGILANNTYKADFIYENLMIASNVIHASYKYGVKKLLNLGSSCIYPKLAPQPLKEEYLLTSQLEPTNEPYAVAKIAAIKLCRYYNEQYKTNFISVMPTNLYGPNDNFNLETAHVLPSIMRKMHLAKLLNQNKFNEILSDLKKYKIGYGCNGSDITTNYDVIKILNQIGIYEDSVLLWGSGKPCREFLYVDDLAKATVFLMQHHNYSDIGELINIGSGQDIAIKILAQLIKNIVGYEGQILFDSIKPDGTPRKLLDISKVKNLGWTQEINLADGLKLMYDCYLQNMDGKSQKESSCLQANQSL